MVSSTEGWAVGPSGRIFRWDGTSWSRVECPINSPLESVDMVSSTDGWVVGRRAATSGINSLTSLGWNQLELMIVGTRTLWSVDMVSSTDGWAVGDGGIIIRWDGIKLAECNKPNYETILFSVDMIIKLMGGL